MVAYVLCAAATIYTQVFAVLALLAQNLYVLFLLARDGRCVGSGSTLRPARSLLLRWTVAQIAIGVLCAPWLISAWSENFEFTVNGSVSSPATMLWRKFTNFTYTAYIPGEISSLATMLWRRFASYTFGVTCAGCNLAARFRSVRRRHHRCRSPRCDSSLCG